jgi:hypothetical protein
MNYSIGTTHSVRIEWKYGLTALADIIGLTLPKGLRPQVITDCADWSERFHTGRVLQIAAGDFDDLGDYPRYIRPGRSMLDFAWTKKSGTVRQESIGHPTVLNQLGQVAQNEVYVDRRVNLSISNTDRPTQKTELLYDHFTYHVSETSDVELTPFHFETLSREERGNSLAIRIGYQMYEAGFRPATLTETLWYAAKFQDEIDESQILVPWAGYSGGFSEGQQLRHHLGLPYVVRNKDILELPMSEFLGQHMSVSRGVDYLAVKI